VIHSRAMAIAAAAVLSIGSFLPTAAMAVVGGGIQPAVTAASSASSPIEKIGCYRLGLSGYHWYGFCAGPSVLYPHRRVCRNHHCYYR
jgi:hypothetical protein